MPRNFYKFGIGRAYRNKLARERYEDQLRKAEQEEENELRTFEDNTGINIVRQTSAVQNSADWLTETDEETVPTAPPEQTINRLYPDLTETIRDFAKTYNVWKMWRNFFKLYQFVSKKGRNCNVTFIVYIVKYSSQS